MPPPFRPKPNQSPGAVARTRTWYQPELEHSWYPNPALGNAPATVFDQGLGQEQPAHWLVQRWFAPEIEAFVPQPPAAAPFDPAALPHLEQPAAWLPQRWFAPEAMAEAIQPPAAAGFDPATLPHAEQPATWQAQRWFAPEALAEAIQPPAAAPFDPATLPHVDDVQQLRPNATTWSLTADLLGVREEPAADETTEGWLAEQPQHWIPQRWVDVTESSVPRIAVAAPFDPATGFDWPEQPASWRPVRWFAPDPESKLPATPPGPITNPFFTNLLLHTELGWTDPVNSGSSALSHIELWHYRILGGSAPNFDSLDPNWTLVDTIAAGVEAYDDYWGRLADYRGSGSQWVTWVAVNVEGLHSAPDLPLDLHARDRVAPDYYGRDASQDRSTSARWFQPDTEIQTPLAQAITTATVAQQAPLWPEQPATWQVQRWVAADPTNVLNPPAAAPFDPANLPHSEDSQQLRPNVQPWALTADLLGVREAPALSDENPWLLEQPGQERSIVSVWRHPDMEWAPTATGDGPSPFSAAAVAGLWQDASGQQDRSIQPVWRHPDDQIVPLVTYPTTATVAQQAALWQEQPAAWTDQRRIGDAIEPWSMAINPNLYAPAGGTPTVLIDATTGDVYLYIGSNFIVPAS